MNKDIVAPALNSVAPAKAGAQFANEIHWIPAFAGMTVGR